MKRDRDLNVGKEIWNELEKVHQFGYSYSTIFSDFLDSVLYALLSLTDNISEKDFIDRLKENKLKGKYEDSYLEVVGRYKENQSKDIGSRPCNYFGKAWWKLQGDTEDVLGEIYMAKISSGEHGQFFTPNHVTNMMAEMAGIGEGETVNDPACGSGRFLISAAKVNKDALLMGIDLSLVCVKMAVINMWLHDLNADIYHGDSLKQEMYRVYRIRKGGFIYENSIS